MKKVVILTALVMLVGVGMFFAAGLLDAYRFERSVAASARRAEASAGAWPQLVDECAQCHGPGGATLNQRYPVLAGQPVSYIADQLHAFATGARRSPQMESLSAALNEPDIASLAHYYAGQGSQAPAGLLQDRAGDADGKALAAKYACAMCHGEGLRGQDRTPRLAGQSVEYVVRELSAFRTRERIDPTGAMNRIAAEVSPDEASALARFLRSARPATTPAD